MQGATCRIKWPESAHAVYIPINDIGEGADRRPFEIFVNSKNMDHYAWTPGLTRMISAVFRRDGGWINERYVPSLLAAIGGVIERHLGSLGPGDGNARQPTARAMSTTAAVCPRCGAHGLSREGG